MSTRSPALNFLPSRESHSGVEQKSHCVTTYSLAGSFCAKSGINETGRQASTMHSGFMLLAYPSGKGARAPRCATYGTKAVESRAAVVQQQIREGERW